MNIKALRESKGITQVQLAALIGVHVNSVRNWETGGGQPSKENMERMMEVLKKDVDTISYL